MTGGDNRKNQELELVQNYGRGWGMDLMSGVLCSGVVPHSVD